MFLRNPRNPSAWLRCLCLAACALFAGLPPAASGQAGAHSEPLAASRILSPQDVQSTFPPSVYFRGKTAPVQLRNASAIRFANQAIFFAGLVDNSGYATAVQETYQMYLLLEQPLRFGGALLPAGAYGAGFVGERFTVMDLGGHTVIEGPTQVDEHLQRPRPLQLLQAGALDVRLYVGRRWVRVETVPAR